MFKLWRCDGGNTSVCVGEFKTWLECFAEKQRLENIDPFSFYIM